MERHRPQHGRPAACVPAQQYSSANFVTLRFHTRKEIFGASLKNITISIFFYFFQKYLSLKLR
jgi:hypothetical protein